MPGWLGGRPHGTRCSDRAVGARFGSGGRAWPFAPCDRQAQWYVAQDKGQSVAVPLGCGVDLAPCVLFQGDETDCSSPLGACSTLFSRSRNTDPGRKSVVLFLPGPGTRRIDRAHRSPSGRSSAGEAAVTSRAVVTARAVPSGRSSPQNARQRRRRTVRPPPRYSAETAGPSRNSLPIVMPMAQVRQPAHGYLR